MKNRKSIQILIPIIAIMIAIIGIGLTTLPSEGTSAYAAGCAVWGSQQSDMTENIVADCEIYTDGEWCFDWWVINCVYSSGETCRAVTCKTIPTCRAIIPT